jgi:hypothetical protein
VRRAEALVPLLEALRSLLGWLRATKTRGVVIGGVAASLLGRPRVTGDVDAVVWIGDASWDAFVKAGRRFDIVPRRPDVIAFARRSRVLLLRHEPSTIDLDVSLGALPFEEEMIARARRHRLGRLSVPLPVPEDLIIMKAIAHRPRDIADIESILEANPGIDEARIRNLVREFAAALETPELSTDLERLLSPRRGRAPRPSTTARSKRSRNRVR